MDGTAEATPDHTPEETNPPEIREKTSSPEEQRKQEILREIDQLPLEQAQEELFRQKAKRLEQAVQDLPLRRAEARRYGVGFTYQITELTQELEHDRNQQTSLKRAYGDQDISQAQIGVLYEQLLDEVRRIRLRRAKTLKAETHKAYHAGAMYSVEQFGFPPTEDMAVYEEALRGPASGDHHEESVQAAYHYVSGLRRTLLTQRLWH